MSPQLETAIIHFLADKFQVSPDSVLPDTDFFIDFNLTPDEFLDLITRMQEALDFIIPEEKISQVQTLSDLFTILASEDTQPHEPL